MQLDFTPMSFIKRRQENNPKLSKSWLLYLSFIGFFLSLIVIADLSLPLATHFRQWSNSQWFLFILFVPLSLLLISILNALLHAFFVLLLGDKLICIFASGFALMREWQGWRVRIESSGLFLGGSSVFSVPTTSRALGLRQFSSFVGKCVFPAGILLLLLWIGKAFPTAFAETSHLTLFYYVFLILSLVVFWSYLANVWLNESSPLPTDSHLRTDAINRKKLYPLFSASHDFGFATDKPLPPESFLHPQDGSNEEVSALLDNFELALAEKKVAQAAMYLNRLLEIATKKPLKAAFEHILYDTAIFEALYGEGSKTARDWLALLPSPTQNLMSIESTQLRLYVESIVLQCEGKSEEAAAVAQQILRQSKRRWDTGFAKRTQQQLLALVENTNINSIPVMVEQRRELSPSLFPTIKTLSLSLIPYTLTVLLVTASIASPDRLSQPRLIGNIFFKLGDAALISGDAKSAAWLFTQVLSRSPRFIPAYQKDAEAQFILGETDKAISDLETALTLTDDSDIQTQIHEQMAEGWFNRGYNLFHSEAYEESAEAFSKALVYRPTWSNALLWRGYVRAFQNQWVQAIADYDKAIELHNGDAIEHAYSLRAAAYGRLKQYDQAIADYQFVLAQDIAPETKRKAESDLAEIYLDQGDDLYKASNFKESIEQFNQAIHYHPGLHRAYWFRGAAYAWLKDYDQAIVDYNLALQNKSDDDWQIIYYRGGAFIAQGRYEDALADYSTAIKLMPSPDWDVYFNRADTYLLLKQQEKAKEDLLYIYESAESAPIRDRALRAIDALRKQKR